jgi:hypothetical protein
VLKMQICVTRPQCVKMAVEKLKIHKSAIIDQISVELIKAGGRTIRFEILQLINSFWNEVELCEQWKESVIISIYKKGTKQCGTYPGIAFQLYTKFSQTPFCQI